MALHIGTGDGGSRFSLPDSYVTETTLIVGQRRSGKSYGAHVVCEELIRIKAPLVLLDPTGAAWGLRSSADGQKKGLPVVILGGAHGDLPLEDTAGKVVADLVVDEPGFFVLDLSGWESRSAEIRFARDFVERLYRRKADKRDPLHLVFDEAETFAPQRVAPDETRLLGAVEAVVKRGGIRGIGSTLITQRQASLSKHVTEQAGRVLAFRTVGPRDRKALDEWIVAVAEPDVRARVMGSVASLPNGTCWVYQPDDGVLERVAIRPRRTFNSSATPQAGETRLEPKVLAAVDLDALRERMAATVAKAEAEDPKLLQKEIARLRKELAEKPAPPELRVERVEVPVFAPDERAELIGSFTRIQQQVNDAAAALGAALLPIIERIESAVASVESPYPAIDREVARYAEENRRRKTERVAVVSQPRDIPERAVSHRGDAQGSLVGGELTGPQRKVLSVLAQFTTDGCSKQKLGMLSGYSAKGGSFNNTLSQLRTAELIGREKIIRITDAGLEALGDYELLPTGWALFDYWVEKVDGPMGRILKALAVAGGGPLSKQEIADATEYKANGGSFNNALSRLRTLELITRGAEIRLDETLIEAIQERVPAGIR